MQIRDTTRQRSFGKISPVVCCSALSCVAVCCSVLQCADAGKTQQQSFGVLSPAYYKRLDWIDWLLYGWHSWQSMFLLCLGNNINHAELERADTVNMRMRSTALTRKISVRLDYRPPNKYAYIQVNE